MVDWFNARPEFVTTAFVMIGDGPDDGEPLFRGLLWDSLSAVVLRASSAVWFIHNLGQELEPLSAPEASRSLAILVDNPLSQPKKMPPCEANAEPPPGSADGGRCDANILVAFLPMKHGLRRHSDR